MSRRSTDTDGPWIVVFAVLIWFFVLSPIRGDIADVESSIEDEQTR